MLTQLAARRAEGAFGRDFYYHHCVRANARVGPTAAATTTSTTTTVITTNERHSSLPGGIGIKDIHVRVRRAGRYDQYPPHSPPSLVKQELHVVIVVDVASAAAVTITPFASGGGGAHRDGHRKAGASGKYSGGSPGAKPRGHAWHRRAVATRREQPEHQRRVNEPWATARDTLTATTVRGG